MKQVKGKLHLTFNRNSMIFNNKRFEVFHGVKELNIERIVAKRGNAVQNYKFTPNKLNRQLRLRGNYTSPLNPSDYAAI